MCLGYVHHRSPHLAGAWLRLGACKAHPLSPFTGITTAGQPTRTSIARYPFAVGRHQPVLLAYRQHAACRSAAGRKRVARRVGELASEQARSTRSLNRVKVAHCVWGVLSPAEVGLSRPGPRSPQSVDLNAPTSPEMQSPARTPNEVTVPGHRSCWSAMVEVKGFDPPDGCPVL